MANIFLGDQAICKEINNKVYIPISGSSYANNIIVKRYSDGYVSLSGAPWYVWIPLNFENEKFTLSVNTGYDTESIDASPIPFELSQYDEYYSGIDEGLPVILNTLLSRCKLHPVEESYGGSGSYGKVKININFIPNFTGMIQVGLRYSVSSSSGSNNYWIKSDFIFCKKGEPIQIDLESNQSHDTQHNSNGLSYVSLYMAYAGTTIID